jgi:DNA-binding winged helix-turn-helix (wHTH) protein/predicted ATPase
VEVRFGRFRLHPTEGLWRGGRELHVTPKSLAVQCALVSRPGQVVTKDELVRAVWPDTAISDSALTSCIKELRKALQDDAKQPAYIETLHRRGYRFVAAIADDAPRVISVVSSGRTGTPLVGRASALECLSESLTRAARGTRQVVFVTGEPGIGKTALVNAFFDTLRERDDCRVSFGQSVEHFSAQEPYQPLLDAVTRLCRRDDGERVVDALRRHAPSWLAQLPAFQTAAESRSLERRTVGTTPERMRRELIDVLESLSAAGTLALWIEDLHWGDPSTLDWLGAIAVRDDPASLLIVVTARTDDVQTGPRLKRLIDTLCARGHAREIALSGLGERDVRALVAGVFPPAAGTETAMNVLSTAVFRRTEGHPLFLVNVLNELVDRGVLVTEDGRWRIHGSIETPLHEVPDDVKRTIEQQIARLDPVERRLLEVASLPAEPFSAAVLAAAVEARPADVERTLTALARRGLFLRGHEVVQWPDGTVSAGFEFLHDLYRDILDAQVSPGDRVELHRRVGERLERAYGERTVAIAPELARHFDEARDLPRAVRYLLAAAEVSRRRGAHGGAEALLRRALTLLESLPPSADRDQREIEIRIALVSVLMALRGWGEPEVQTHCDRAIALSEQSASSRLFLSLWGLWLFRWGRGLLNEAEQVVVKLQSLAAQSNESGVALQACHAVWATSFSTGRLADTVASAARGGAIYDVDQHAAMASAFGSHDAGTCGLSFSARALVLMGRLDEAARQTETSLVLARRLGHPFSLGLALVFAATVHQERGDVDRARACAESASAICAEHGFGLMQAWAAVMEGWVAVERGDVAGIGRMERAIATMRSVGSFQFVTHFLGVFAGALLRCGRIEQAGHTVADAIGLVEQTGELFYQAELIRLQGELVTAVQGRQGGDIARRYFEQATAIARAQGATLLERRAAESLAACR